MVFIIKENVSNSLKNFQGLTDEEVVLSKEKYGLNKLTEKKKESLILKILSIFKEPMFLLLIIAASVYFVVGEYSDGIILYSQSLGVNESCLIGESVVVYKSKKDDNNNHFKLNMCYSGTDIINGMGVIKIIAVGKNTEFRLKGLLIFIVVFLTYLYLLNNTTDINLATTIAYSTLVLDIMFITYQLKDSKNTILTFIESFKDKVSTIVTSGIILGLLAFIYLPFYNKVANTLPLDIKWWLLIIFLVLISVKHFDILKIKRNKK